MKKIRTLSKLSVAILLTLALAACSTPSTGDETTGNETNGNANPSESDKPADQEEDKKEEPKKEPSEDSKDDDSKDKPAAPQTKDIKYEIEGMEEVRVGTLAEGSSGKYYMYIFDDFELRAEDDGNDLLVFKNDEEFYVRAEPLDQSANIEEIKTNSESELKEIGNVHDLTNDENMISFLQETKFHLLGSGNLLSKHILVKEIDGQLFRFTINMPVKESAEGVTPTYYAMLQTIEIK